MLGYRHGFHAGNLADVFKHTVLCAVLDAARAKSAPICYLDTHAGAGIYDLRDPSLPATESEAGIARLWPAPDRDAPPPVDLYLHIVGAENARVLRYYPGSCVIAAQLLPPPHRLILCEQHPTDYSNLARRFAAHANVRVVQGDGYAELRSALPPNETRAIVLIDPAYELRDEPTRVIEGLEAALSRMRHGTYLVWYPLTGKHDPLRFLRTFVRTDPPKTVKLELRPPTSAPAGAVASGMLVVNPPYRAIEPLRTLLPYLQPRLAPGGSYTFEWLVEE